MRQLGVEMIPAYSPEARGRSVRRGSAARRKRTDSARTRARANAGAPRRDSSRWASGGDDCRERDIPVCRPNGLSSGLPEKTSGFPAIRASVRGAAGSDGVASWTSMIVLPQTSRKPGYPTLVQARQPTATTELRAAGVRGDQCGDRPGAHDEDAPKLQSW